MDNHDIKLRAWDGRFNQFVYFNARSGLHSLEPKAPTMQYTGYNYKDTEEKMFTGDVVYIAGLGNCEIGIDKFYGIVAIQGKYETPLVDCILEGDHPVKLGDKYQNPELLK